MIDAVLSAVRDARDRVSRSAPLWPLREARRRILRRSEGESLLLQRFLAEHGRPLDVANPRTFTEKLFCRMVRWNRSMDPRFSRLADKLEVRAFVRAKVGEQHLVKLLWHGTRAERIPFDALPASFVIKASHGSGHVLRVLESADRGQLTEQASAWLTANYYWRYREYQYFRIPPRLLVEEHLANPDGGEALVFRFWCFHGAPEVVNVGNFARSMSPFYDPRWNRIDLATRHRGPQPAVEKPRNFDQMITVASRLSEEFDFVRVDLFNVAGRTYFNELTFTPAAGKLHFSPPDWDEKLGGLWTLRD